MKSDATLAPTATTATTLTRFRPFTALTANVKRPMQSIPLGPLTLFVGERGTYKSSAIIAAELALTGEYGPAGKLPSDLIRLSADRTQGLYTTLESADGTVSWQLKINPDTGKAMKPFPPDFDGKLKALTDDERYCIVPSVSVEALLKNARGDKKLREALIRRFGGSLKNLPEPFALDDEERAVWDAAVVLTTSRLDKDASADTLLASLSEYFRLESLALGRQMKPLQTNIDTKRKALNQSSAGIELLPELEGKLKKARAYETTSTDRGRETVLAAEVTNLAAELANLDDEVANLEKVHDAESALEANQLDALSESEARALTELLQVTMRLGNAQWNAELFKKKHEEGATKCPYCPNDKLHPKHNCATAEFFKKKETDLEAQMKVARDRHDASRALLTEEGQRLAARQRQRDAAKWALESRVDGRRMRFAEATSELEAIRGRLKTTPGTYTGPTSTELQSQVDGLRRTADEKVALEKEGRAVRTMSKQHDILKKLEGQAMDMQKQLMVSIARKASDEVTLGMFGQYRAELDPETCEWSVLGENGEMNPYWCACGTEKTALRLGLYAAWTRDSPLRVGIFDIDEELVGLSSDGFKEFFLACEAALDRGDLTQILVVSNRPDVLPDNLDRWLIHQTGVTARHPSEVRA